MVALPQWFFKVSAIKENLLKHNEEVNWSPKWGKERFRNWLDNINDWPVSRNRYWGTPLPIWTCDKCNEYDVIGTYDELETKTGKKVERTISGIHRPNIDNYTYKCKCGGTKHRIKDVLDVWFDSGATSWGALHYPHYDDLYNKYWPADFNVEGTDQFRGWWNSQIILSEITFEKKPFKNIMVHGMVLDINKREMHKSWGNVISPEDIIEKENRDFLRYFFIKESKGEDFAFGLELFKDINRNFNIVSNMANYMYTYLDLNLDNIYSKDLPSNLSSEDYWILSRLNSVKKEILESYDGYIYHKVPSLIEGFLIDDLSRTYLKIVKDRKDIDNISKVLSYVFGNSLRLLAPIMPHYADFIYKNFNFGTIHLSEITDTDVSLINTDLEEEMKLVDKVVNVCLKLREQEKLRLRWTLPEANVVFKEKKIKYLESMLKKMMNVEKVSYVVS
jgi:isoleucyl-tRNA synthetase